MVKRIKWIEHKGKKVLYADYSGLSGEAYVEAIEEGIEFTSEMKQSGLLSCMNLNNTYANQEVLTAGKKLAELSKAHLAKAAVVGLTGVQYYFLHVVNALVSFEIKPFDSDEEALDWLTS